LGGYPRARFRGRSQGGPDESEAYREDLPRDKKGGTRGSKQALSGARGK